VNTHPSKCLRCSLRWADSYDGLCGVCERWLEANWRAVLGEQPIGPGMAQALSQRDPAEPEPAPRRVVEIDGQAFEVIWDGRGPLPRR
jgi:hypothetical protein